MTTFALRIKPSVQAELDAAASNETLGHFHTAFQHLERAHVLSQPTTGEHVRVHWRMFRFAVRNRMTGEALGQAWRIVTAAIFSAFGLVPEGNTGGASVSGLRRMPVPQDLQTIIKTARHQPEQLTARRKLSAASAAVAALVASGLTGCMTAPKDLDVSLEKQSAAGVYQVALVPPAQMPAVNGGMPQHGHSLPTQPRVTRELADGTYQLDGMKFSMTGWWELKLAIDGPQGADKVTFNTVIESPNARQ